jgi:hypothetical protein
MTSDRKTLIAVVAGAAVLLTIALATRVVPAGWRVAVLVVVCLLIAAVATLLPEHVRRNLRTPAAAFVAAMGVLAIFIQTSPQQQATEERTNTRYLADLIRKGPFTETLPSPLVAGVLDEVRIADPGAARKVDATELEIRVDPVKGQESGVLDLQSFAHLEVYPTRAEAARRGGASLEELKRRYDGGVRGGPESFCVHGGTTGDFWTCASVRDFVYAEVTVSPAPNANLPFATGTLGALLRYADRQTDLATP